MVEPKDCDCQTHDRPHYLHMDAITKEKNERILLSAERADKRGDSASAANLRATFVWAENRRIIEKLRAMQTQEAHQ